MIERNKNPAGVFSNAIFGMCNILDGLVRVFSLGHLHTRLPLSYAKYQAMAVFEKKKAQALNTN